MNLTAEDVAHWRQWIGKVTNITENIEPLILKRYAAALGEEWSPERPMPSLAHWAFFIDAVQPDELGQDGHPKRGGFLPPVTLPRRMFAASNIRFFEPLVANLPATRTSVIADLTHKSGKSGDLILLEVVHDIEQGGRSCISEKQTIIYRDAGAPIAPVEDKRHVAKEGTLLWKPGTTDLFRFSAATFNSHRIHYDLPYARDEEGYPGLVVHGPFTAARLYGFARKLHGDPQRFTFRAQAPMFVDQPILIAPGVHASQFIAERCDGAEAMTAIFEI